MPDLVPPVEIVQRGLFVEGGCAEMVFFCCCNLSYVIGNGTVAM